MKLIRFADALLLMLTYGFSGLAMAQSTTAPSTPVMPAEEKKNPLLVGDATAQLLAMQRAGAGADRPISGEQAGLSYQRYLDSFKRPIPDEMGSSVRRGGKAD